MGVKLLKYSFWDGLELKEATFRNQDFPQHFHDYYSIGIIEFGVEKLFVADKALILTPGSVIILNPYEPHAHGNYNSDSWKYRTVNLSPDVVKYLIPQALQKKSTRFVFDTNIIQDDHLFNQLLNFHDQPANSNPDELAAIMNYAIRKYSAVPYSGKVRLDEKFNEVLFYIESNFFQKISIDALAEKMRMKKFHFIRTFKIEIGLTPGNYLIMRRIEHAKKMIVQGLPIVEVALDSGFYDQSHFNHFFKKYTGISPLAFRKNSVIIDALPTHSNIIQVSTLQEQ